MITILQQQLETPGWAKAIFIAIFLAILQGIKSLFSKKKNDDE